MQNVAQQLMMTCMRSAEYHTHEKLSPYPYPTFTPPSLQTISTHHVAQHPHNPKQTTLLRPSHL